MRRLTSCFLAAAAVVLLLCSLLVLVSAPTEWLWIVAILMGEWGHFVALGSLVLALVSVPRGRLGGITALVALVAAALCLVPVVRAAIIGRSLPQLCTAAFGDAAAAREEKAAPFSLAGLVRRDPVSDVDVSEHIYASAGRKPLELDLYRAKSAVGVQPLIIVVYGGSWNGGSKEQLPAMNRYLARKQYTVAAINYRHAPKQPFPAPVDDVFRAIDFLKAHAAEFQLDPTRIVLIGRSAGGQIALSAAYAAREPSIRGVVSFYAPTDLVLGYQTPSAVLDSNKALENYLGGSPAQKPEGYAAASPVNHVSASTPPTLLIHGALDPIVWPIHSELLTERLQQAGVKNLYLRLPWATHGCDANLSGPSGQLSMYAIERFLAPLLGSPK
jgi:acetyl esterase/lipase